MKVIVVMNARERMANRLKQKRTALSVKYHSSTRREVLNRIGQYWSEKEERALVNRFLRGVTLDQMCRFHRRDTGGILARLKSLGLIENFEQSYCNTMTWSVYLTFDDVKKIKERLNRNIKHKLRVIE